MNSVSEKDGLKAELEPNPNELPTKSQTASEFIDQQLALEADAREILPYKFDTCTNILGPLRQEVFACLTCSPPPASPAQLYTPAGVCYACSISCHGEHNLVELFSRRNFVCDCGTTRLPSTLSCTLRSDPATSQKGVSSQEPAPANRYNHNFQNQFCACQEEYDADKEKGTMYQCVGLGSVDTGGCGEDWYHPECLMGLPKEWYTSTEQKTDNASAIHDSKHNDQPVPPGFPDEDDFDAIICYKCVESNPWIKQYAGTPGFLHPLFKQEINLSSSTDGGKHASNVNKFGLKRKASDDDLDARPSSPLKRTKQENTPLDQTAVTNDDENATSGLNHIHERLPQAPEGIFSILLKQNFREHLCHCPKCYVNLSPHPQLVEEEETYEPSISESNESGIGPRSGAQSHGTGSLLDRGEAALSTVDRVKAIEGVMVYNHLKDKVKEFLKPYAENGKAVSAEDIKAYFEKLRGDEGAIKEAGKRPIPGDDESDRDNRREQSGY